MKELTFDEAKKMVEEFLKSDNEKTKTKTYKALFPIFALVEFIDNDCNGFYFDDDNWSVSGWCHDVWIIFKDSNNKEIVLLACLYHGDFYIYRV